jgi:hypothetical protein
MIWTARHSPGKIILEPPKPEIMLPAVAARRAFPEPSIAVFLGLQALDVLTTFLGLRVGAKETSIFVGQLLRLGPLAGLLISKCFALILLGAALGFHRPRVVVFLNYWFAAIVSWNLITVFVSMSRL